MQLRTIVAVTVLFLPWFAVAAAPNPKLDSRILRATRTGVASVHSMLRLRDRAPVIIELEAPADAVAFGALRAAGVELDLVEGAPLHYGRFVAAHVSEVAAHAAAKLSIVHHVGLAPLHRDLPLDHSAELIRLADGRGARPALDLLTGAGVTIGDDDSLVDVFEPAFFRGDAGYYDWIDTDLDNQFTPGIDAIDLNHDGKADVGETTRLLRAGTYDTFSFTPIKGARPSADFDPGLDWVYIDVNGNGLRDYGPPMFDETTPAYGEPLFTPDDLNRNGRLDPGEKLVQLGTSKFKKVRVNIDYLASLDQVFTRGTDLSQTPVDLTQSQAYGFPDALHATGVSTILAGDLPLAGRKWVGMAPDADLLLSFDIESGGDQLGASGVMWLLGEKPDVMLYEMAPWTGVALDGSDELSKLIDASTASDNVTHTCPVGDQGSAQKHARTNLLAGASFDLPMILPAMIKDGQGPLSNVEITMHLLGGDAASVALVAPDGTVTPMTDQLNSATGPDADHAFLYVAVSTTDRGTHLYDTILYTDQSQGSQLPVGTYKIRVTAGSAPLTVHGYVSDNVSSWAAGAEWDTSVATDDATIGVPSTADHCIAVGAMPDHIVASSAPWYDMFYYAYDVPDGFKETQYELRAYSPQGPRMDGVTKPDIVAPDNPWVAGVHATTDVGTVPYGSYGVFGGTSGASPHVTGVAALLAQAGIKGDAARDAIRTGAAVDTAMGTLPNGKYGYGRLDVASALGATTIGTLPTVTATFSPAKPTATEDVTLTLTASGGDGLEMKWDDDYDGTWDTTYAAIAPRVVRAKMLDQTKRDFKVRVRNASGQFAEALVVVPFYAKSKGGCHCHATGEPAADLAGLAMMLVILAIYRRWALTAQPQRRSRATT